MNNDIAALEKAHSTAWDIAEKSYFDASLAPVVEGNIPSAEEIDQIMRHAYSEGYRAALRSTAPHLLTDAVVQNAVTRAFPEQSDPFPSSVPPERPLTQVSVGENVIPLKPGRPGVGRPNNPSASAQVLAFKPRG